MDIPIELTLFLGGIVGGFLSGLLGIGGGIIYILIIPIGLSKLGFTSAQMVPYIVSNSLFTTLFAGLINSLLLIRAKFYFLKDVLWASLGACAASILTFQLILPQPWYNKTAFTVLIILLLIPMIFNFLKKKTVAAIELSAEENLPNWKYSAAGILGGLITTLSGLGGGLVMVPLLSAGLKLNIKRAASVSIGVVFFVSLAVTLTNLFKNHTLFIHPDLNYHSMGYLVFEIAAFLTLGVFVGTPIGTYTSRKTPVERLRIFFGLFLVVVLCKKIFDLFL